MKNIKLYFLIALLLVCTACPLPDVSKFAKITLDLSESIKTSSSNIVDFLTDAMSSYPVDENKMDPKIIRDLDRISGNKDNNDRKSMDFVKILNKSLNEINSTLDAMVAYSDALVGIKNAGSKGKESFNSLANSLNNLLSIPGIAPISEASTLVGKYLYGAIANIRAANKLEDVIINADTVVQYVSKHLDSTLINLNVINNVARSQYLINTVYSKNSQQISELNKSLIEKEKRLRTKITLLNDYENGDIESLLFFLYEDVQSLYNLQNQELTNQINNIYNTSGLSPQQQIEQISLIAKGSFNAQIKNEILAPGIYNRLNIPVRKSQIQDELDFIRKELIITEAEFNEIKQNQNEIERIHKSNNKFLQTARKANKSWAKYHGNMLVYLQKNQTPSFNELQLYINEIILLNNELVELKKQK